ncbi:COG4315 family predicted lipoprotein [Streptomonospora salina]|uniref:Putative lipoprotein with Yx(FWY)xxD motif n=1 Tax=Streptomonospora salina TaxID=104205 RepID=A0A841E3V5_9ACTN|nr:hypothetical protein [Streptomonospora salina]MBB5997835.1 putative lipoprotein with Yx(FWY)xxD motif [Streptomonospora salina]
MGSSSAIRLHLAAGATAVLAASGCGADLSEGGVSDTPDLPGEDASSEVAATLGVAGDTAAGSVVTDSDGYTLYTYTGDGSDPSYSACTGGCAEQWPPALADGRLSTDGVDEDLAGRMERTGGGTQVTLSGKPLYRFSGDVDPGDVNGQGVDGTWFAVRPSGERAEDLPYGAEDGTGGPRGD